MMSEAQAAREPEIAREFKQVHDEMQHLEKELEALGIDLRDLESGIESVLTPNIPTDEKQMDSTSQPSQPPCNTAMAANIRVITAKIGGLCGEVALLGKRVRSMRNRSELPVVSQNGGALVNRYSILPDEIDRPRNY